MRRAGPVILEPMMAVEIETPEDYMGDIMGDILPVAACCKVWMTILPAVRWSRRKFRWRNVRLLDAAFDVSGSRYVLHGVQTIPKLRSNVAEGLSTARSNTFWDPLKNSKGKVERTNRT